MNGPLIMFEEIFDLHFAEESWRVDFLTGDEATCLTASLWNDNSADKNRERGRVVVKTRGYAAQLNRRATIIVARRTGAILKLPDDAGRFVAEFGSKYDFHRWMVFEAKPFLGQKEVEPPLAPLPKTSPELPLPQRGSHSPSARPAPPAAKAPQVAEASSPFGDLFPGE